MKLPRKNFVYDLVHRSCVVGLIGTMCFTMGSIAHQVYYRVKVVAPMNAELIKVIKEHEMKEAQAIREKELMMEGQGQ